MTGRPPFDFTDDVVQEIVDRLTSGESIRSISRDAHMPGVATFYIRMSQDVAFRNTIVSAREAQQDAMMDDTIDMADAATVEDHQVVKLRIWARQWRASKLAPKKYGDRLDLNHSGEMKVTQALDLSPLTQLERDQMRALIAKSEKAAEHERAED